jgi:CheY-like chemotaxis protein/two-component sensor histidine kinase
MGTCTDIHVEKLAEDALRESGKRKDEFLAMLAHELRNPLAPISTAAELIKISGIDEKRLHQASAIISRQVRHMTTLVDDLLDVSRVTRGLTKLDSEPVELKSVLHSAIEQVRPLIEARHHELRLRIGSTNAIVLGDKTRLIQVVANILNNAAKYTPQSGEISLALEVTDTEARIKISDNGSGIAPSLLPHIFDLFTQGERTPDRGQGGLGLGLSLAKSITSLHGGRVDATSEGMGKGTTITIVLPLQKSEQRQPVAVAEDDIAPQSVIPLRLMIVDDNVDAAQSLAALLEAKGHHVIVEENADSALRSIERGSVQIFILDIGLPGMDGYELARRLRAHPQTANGILIALTGYGQAHDRVLSKAAGFDHHFVKPIDTQHLAILLTQIAN